MVVGRASDLQRIRAENRRRSEEVLAQLLSEVGPLSRLVDVGCGEPATTTQRWAAVVQARTVVGIDVNRSHLGAAPLPVVAADLERDGLPLGTGSVDVVVLHQVLEHLKNVHHVLAECHRVLRPAGWLALGLPNLASLHNRVLLLAGRQPTSIRARSPHVRGLTRREALALVESFGFAVARSRGAGFYPARGRLMAALDRRLPAASVFQCHLFHRLDDLPERALQPFETADTNFWLPAPAHLRSSRSTRP
jgi:SAM-dependent methyltransferase